MKIGERIRQVLKSQGRTASWLAEAIPCERTNVYNIFGRADINVRLLGRISVVLGHDFFADLSHELSTGEDQWERPCATHGNSA